MRILLVALVLLSCTGLLLAAPAGATPVKLTVPQLTSTNPPAENSPGSYDPYVGQGSLITKAVPVCCCSFGFCEDNPNGMCVGGPGWPTCHCNASGFGCIHT